MKKFEIIREIFETVIRAGFNDDKQDAISGYTRDKMKNPVYVKKIQFEGTNQIDSIAVTALESDFSDACDSDVRIAFKSNVGTRVILYANEVDTTTLLEVLNYLRKNIGANRDVEAFHEAMQCIEDNAKIGNSTDLTEPFMNHIFKRYYETFVKPVIK